MKAWRIHAALVAMLVTLALTACGGDSGGDAPSSSGSATPSASADRPSSPAELKIIAPANGAIVEGTTAEMKVSLKHAELVPATTTNIVPDEGHLHVILDDQLISMTGDTTQLLANLTPGQHLLKVEFVASDHAPFDPRVIAVSAFEVQA